MSPSKPRVPEYPRPVPQVCTDEIPTCRDTVVYDDQTLGADVDADADAESEQRAAKRRRIEACASAYLRGEPLFILSAQLKGPFDRDWKNPWAKKRGNATRLAQQDEVPETAPRPQVQVAQVEEQPHRDARPKRKLPEPTSPTDVDRLPNPFATGGRSDFPRPSASSSASDGRVEEWLKRTRTVTRSPRKPITSSPTPTPSRLQEKSTNRAAAKSTAGKTLPGSSGDGIRHVPAGDGSVSGTRPSAATKALRRVHPRANKDESGSQKHSISDPITAASQKVMPPVKQSQVSPADKRAAEETKDSKSSKRYQMAPPSTNLSAFEYRRVLRSDENDERTGSQRHSKAAALALSADQRDEPLEAPRAEDNDEPASLSTAEASRPAPSIETSRTSAIIDLPSAQPLEHPLMPPAPSSVFTSDKLLQEPLLPSDPPHPIQQQQEDPHTVSNDLHNSHAAAAAAADAKDLHLHLHVDMKSPATMDTQEMIASITPFVTSTVKKQTAASSKLSPTRTSKGVDDLKEKKSRASLGTEGSSGSSQVSLKSALKVAKRKTTSFSESVLVPQTGSSLLPVAKSKYSSAFEQHQKPVANPGSATGQVKPRSILKSFHDTATSIHHQNVSSSTTTKQDAQNPARIAEKPGDEDDFDLDAAIDDLGSYLGHWDAEKEAGLLPASNDV